MNKLFTFSIYAVIIIVFGILGYYIGRIWENKNLGMIVGAFVGGGVVGFHYMKTKRSADADNVEEYFFS